VVRVAVTVLAGDAAGFGAEAHALNNATHTSAFLRDPRSVRTPPRHSLLINFRYHRATRFVQRRR
jgi:hypothetical protein